MNLILWKELNLWKTNWMMRNKYSKLIVDEAARLKESLPTREVVRLTGVGKKTIQKAWEKLRLKKGIPLNPPMVKLKYTPAQKIQCIKLAFKYIETGHIRSKKKAFIAAGNVLKINGVSIYCQWMERNVRGVTGQFTQQPGTGSPVVSGASMRAANPQSHLWATHRDPAPDIFPAPSIIRRRKYTSDMIPPGVLKGHRPQT